ncbi:MAG TPA: TetR/AcrR family transcriptional regulator [Acidimicrobiales bacterium]|nr:TetR/AcrR family transcriptional regulator [Acidimicrobiales bacterium]
MSETKSGATQTPTRRRREGPSKGDLKKDAILDTAWQLLGTKPMTAITIDELSTGAGISRSSFYFYFDSRAAVIRALADRTSVELSQSIRTALTAATSPHDAITALNRTLLARWRANGPLMRAMDVLAENDDELRAFWRGVTDDVVRAGAQSIEDERAAGRALPGPPSAMDLAVALTNMYWRSGQQASLEPGSEKDDEHLIETLTAITLRAIYGQP